MASAAFEPRAVFDAALCYERATRLLVDHSHGIETDRLRLLPAMCSIAAFTVELYIKCLLTDLNCTIPLKHTLPELFRNLPRQVKEQIKKRYESDAARVFIVEHLVSHGWKRDDCTLENELFHSGDGFDDWRYYFENSGKRLGLNSFENMHRVLREFILEKHPEWVSDASLFFRSTFPTR